MTDFDAVIVGAGIAGCAGAVELLLQGRRVGIVHQREDTSCIESLSPDAVYNLRRLAVDLGSEFATVIAWWGSDREMQATAPGAHVVQRTALAGCLRLAAAERGAQFVKTTNILSVESVRDGWRLRCEGMSKRQCELTARYVVDATGRAAVVGRRLGARRQTLDQLFSISMSVPKPGLVGTWTESTSDGWWNLCSTQNEGTLSFYSTVPGVHNARKSLAAGFYSTRHLVNIVSKIPTDEKQIRACSSSRLIPCAGPGWAAIGDAALTFQPLTSAGVAKALRDARTIQRALDKPAEYQRLQLVEFRSYLRQLAHHYALEKRWPANPFWASVDYGFVNTGRS